MIALQMGFREKHPVTHLVFSPDQGTLAVAQPHAGVTLLERATGQTLAVCPTPRRGVLTGLAFTGDGRLLVAASAKGLSVFDAGSGALVAGGTHGANNGLMLANTPGGVLGVRPEGRWREWATAELLDGSFNLQRPRGVALGKALAVAPGGRFAAVARQGGRAMLFDLARGRATAGLDRWAPLASFPSTEFCPLGHRVAINDGTAIDVYDLAGASDEANDEPAGDGVAPAPRAVLSPVFSLHSEKVGEVRGWYTPFALLGDGRGVLVKRPRNRVQLWDAPANARVGEWSWRLEWVTCLAAAPDGLTAAAGGRFGRVLLWDLD